MSKDRLNKEMVEKLFKEDIPSYELIKSKVEDRLNKNLVNSIFDDLFAKVGFDGHVVGIYKNDLILIAKK